jgi:hypothetical protein
MNVCVEKLSVIAINKTVQIITLKCYDLNVTS